MANSRQAGVAGSAFLPEGFTPTGGAAGQSEVVHMFVTSFVCGGEKPTLEMYKAYVSVDPPSKPVAGAGLGLDGVSLNR